MVGAFLLARIDGRGLGLQPGQAERGGPAADFAGERTRSGLVAFFGGQFGQQRLLGECQRQPASPLRQSGGAFLPLPGQR